MAYLPIAVALGVGLAGRAYVERNGLVLDDPELSVCRTAGNRHG